MKKQLWFNSSMFPRVAGEEEKTNPGRLGESFATWVRDKLMTRGHSSIEPPIPEDWGWIIMVRRAPFPLWIGFGNEDESTTRWSCFVQAEPGLFQRLFKRIDTGPATKSLEEELEDIIRSEPQISNTIWESADPDAEPSALAEQAAGGFEDQEK